MSGTVLERIERAEVQHQSLYGGEIGVFGTVRAVRTDPDLPINSAIGFGRDLSNLSEVEAFYRARNLPARVILYSHCPAVTLLEARGYRLTQQLNIHARSLTELSAPLTGPLQPALKVRVAQPLEFASVSALSFGPGSEAIMERTSQRLNTALYVAELNGQTIGAGAMSMFDDVALLYSAATVPAFRGKGAQTALLARRLADAGMARATLAAVITTAGSSSEQNVNRAGFVLMGTRLSFELSELSLT